MVNGIFQISREDIVKTIKRDLITTLASVGYSITCSLLINYYK